MLCTNIGPTSVPTLYEWNTYLQYISLNWQIISSCRYPTISDFPSIKYVNARFCFSCGLRVREKPFGPFQAWRTKPLLVLPCISFACPAMHVRLKHVCVSMVSFSRVQFEMVCAEMLLEITKNVWMSSLWIHLFFWNSGACENRVRKKNDIFVSVLDGQTCIILESQHIYVYVCYCSFVSFFPYLCYSFFVFQFAMQPPGSMFSGFPHVLKKTCILKKPLQIKNIVYASGFGWL